MKYWFTSLSLFVAIVSPSVSAADGKAIYLQICRACHATGIAGAPVMGDRNAWQPRISAGSEVLLESALRGKGGMPPKGGNPGLSDAQVRAAMEYMISQSK